MAKPNFPKRGDVYWIELDPAIGTETKKKRPCVILSNNSHNKHMSRVVAAPITSQIKTVYPFEIVVQVKEQTGKIMLDQIRCFDKQRINGKLGEFNQTTMQEIEARLKLLFNIF